MTTGGTDRHVRAVGMVLVAVLAGAAAVRSGPPVDLPVMDGLPTAQPEEVGLSPSRLERLDRVMKGYVDRNDVAGSYFGMCGLS